MMERNIVDPYRAYAFDQMKDELCRLKKTAGGAISVGVFGRSRQGRELIAARLGMGERQALLVGAHHAREYIGSALLMRMLEHYARRYGENDEAALLQRRLLDEISLCFVPMLNPDGVEIAVYGKEALTEENQNILCVQDSYHSWKANAAGVDLNRNYPCLFELKKSAMNVPASEMYKGPYAASEPEVRALMELCESRRFAAAITLHAKGEEIYYGDSNTPAAAQLGLPLAARIAAQNGYALAPVSSDPRIFAAGFENWFRARFARPCLLVELAPYDGPVPHDMRRFDELAWHKNRDMGMIFAQYVSDHTKL